MISFDNFASGRGWTTLCYAYGLLVAALGAYFLLGLPVQLTDSFGLMLDAQGTTLWELLRSHFSQPAYMRPFLWGQTKIALILSGGHYYWLFRGLHALQFVVLVLLFVRLLRPRTAVDACVVPLALAVLVGIHTLQGTIREGFPINTFMTILICCLLAANMAFAKPAWWVDVGAAALFVFAALTVESGLLVWVVFACAWLTGAGLSRWGMAVTTALMVGYFVLRFGMLDIGSPGLIERSSGYGFRYLEPSDLIRMFGDDPKGFYAYNVLTSIASVLFAEPRAGIFTLTRSVVEGEPNLALVINVVASVAASLTILAFVWRRRRNWLARDFNHDDRLVFLFAGVLVANAAISYGYTKDPIMSPAGVFYAAAVFVAVRGFAEWLSPARRLVTVTAAVFCLVLSLSWSVRAVGAFAGLRHQVFNVRSDWADYEDFVKDNPLTLDAKGEALKEVLQRDAIERYPPSSLVGNWVALFDVD